jgi:hypothetical protein
MPIAARILETAGFDDVRFEEVHEPVLYGRDLHTALAVVTGFRTRVGPREPGRWRRAPSSASGKCSRLTTATSAAWCRFALVVDHRPAAPVGR